LAQKVLVIVGPTAVGKTDLSIKLAHLFNGEVISGDSMQVYKGLDIGTAKVTEQEMEGVDHFLLDILQPDQNFSVADFVTYSQDKIEQISMKNHLPLVVGGTGLYVQALVDEFNLGSTSNFGDKNVRIQLEDFAAKNGKKALWQKLDQIDPTAAKKIPVNNERRVVRALEVYQQTGHLFSEQDDSASGKLDPLIIGLNTERKLLYQRIDSRVDQMVDNGLLKEAHALYEAGGTKLPAGKGIGYKELIPYFAGDEKLSDCIEAIKKNSRHYAKRQLTWFRNRMNVLWFDLVLHPEQINEIKRLISKWLNDEKIN